MGLRILVSGDWHLDSPLTAHPELRELQRQIPGRIADLSLREKCDLVLLPGDLFEGEYTKNSLLAVQSALEQMGVPVFITPGNHDYYGGKSPYDREVFPRNVHIFKENTMTAVPLPNLGCTVYGAAFWGPEPSDFLRDFQPQGKEYQIGILHSCFGESTAPISPAEARGCGLHFFALGHIHKAGHVRAGNTLCLWPGCPMGRDFGETGKKGAWIVDVDASGVKHRFCPLDFPAFYEETVDVEKPVLPVIHSGDYHRITLIGRGSRPALPVIPNVTWVDATLPPLDVWASAEEDSFEGLFFRKLRRQVDAGDQTAALAAELTRRLLDGEEVLPC